MEAPVAIAVLREMLHRVAAAHHHVADVELEAHHRRIEPRDEDIIWYLTVDGLHVVGLIMEREPEIRLSRRRAGRVETVSPLLPIVERLHRFGIARHDQILHPE